VDIENTPSLGKEGNGIFGGRIEKSVGKLTLVSLFWKNQILRHYDFKDHPWFVN